MDNTPTTPLKISQMVALIILEQMMVSTLTGRVLVKYPSGPRMVL